MGRRAASLYFYFSQVPVPKKKALDLSHLEEDDDDDMVPGTPPSKKVMVV